MIGCNITGGLGNQFFRYAFARKLQEDRRAMGLDDELVISGYGIDQHGSDGNLFDFNLPPHRRVDVKRMVMEFGSIWQRMLYSAFALNRKTNLLHSNLKEELLWLMGQAGVVISENPDNETLYLPKASVSRVFVHGSFENAGYFAGIEDKLRAEITPPNCH